MFLFSFSINLAMFYAYHFTLQFSMKTVNFNVFFYVCLLFYLKYFPCKSLILSSSILIPFQLKTEGWNNSELIALLAQLGWHYICYFSSKMFCISLAQQVQIPEIYFSKVKEKGIVLKRLLFLNELETRFLESNTNKINQSANGKVDRI